MDRKLPNSIIVYHKKGNLKPSEIEVHNHDNTHCPSINGHQLCVLLALALSHICMHIQQPNKLQKQQRPYGNQEVDRVLNFGKRDCVAMRHDLGTPLFQGISFTEIWVVTQFKRERNTVI